MKSEIGNSLFFSSVIFGVTLDQMTGSSEDYTVSVCQRRLLATTLDHEKLCNTVYK